MNLSFAPSPIQARTLTELESELRMTRFGVMKLLRVLEAAGPIATGKVAARNGTT